MEGTPDPPITEQSRRAALRCAETMEAFAVAVQSLLYPYIPVVLSFFLPVLGLFLKLGFLS